MVVFLGDLLGAFRVIGWPCKEMDILERKLWKVAVAISEVAEEWGEVRLKRRCGRRRWEVAV